MEDNYPKAYKEVLEVLKYVPEDDVKKIPQTLIDTFIENMDIDYNFNLNTNVEFEEQILLDETQAILANIFKDYWATPSQKREIEIKEINDIKKIEEEKKLKYNSDNLFKGTQKDKTELKKDIPLVENEKSNLPAEIEIKKENFFKKLINYIKRFITKKID